MVRKIQNPAENREFLPLVEQGFMYGASLLKAQVEASSDKDQKLDNKLKRPNDSDQGGYEAMDLKRQRICINDQTGLPAIMEILSCPELEKEICGTEEDMHPGEAYQPVLPDKIDNLEVEEDGGSLRASCCIDEQPARMINNAGGQSIMSALQELEGGNKGIPHSQHCSGEHGLTKQHVSHFEEAAGPSSTDIFNNISLVETIYSERMEKLLADQSKESAQFKEERNRIKQESRAKLLKEHMHKSALVREKHPQIEVRLVELRIADMEFVRKLEVITNLLNTEQEKLDSTHKDARKVEKELKYHWLEEAKSGRPVDAFSILPQFLRSCFNLDNLKKCEKGYSKEMIPDGTVSLGLCQMEVAGPSEVVRGHSPVAEGTIPTATPSDIQVQGHPLTISPSNDTSMLPLAVQLELPTSMDSVSELVQSKESDVDISLAVQLKRSLAANLPSELGRDTPVSEKSLLCEPAKEDNHVPFSKLDEDLARMCVVDRAQPENLHEKLKVHINTDFEKEMTEEMCSKLIHNVDAAVDDEPENSSRLGPDTSIHYDNQLDFASKDDATEWAIQKGKEINCILVKGRRTNYKWVEMVCKRSGEYRSHKKKGYVYSKKTDRVFKTKKCGCPFKIVFHKVEGDIWRMYEVANGCHNHDEDDASAQKKKAVTASFNRVTGHSKHIKKVRKTTDFEKEMMEEMCSKFIHDADAAVDDQPKSASQLGPDTSCHYDIKLNFASKDDITEWAIQKGKEINCILVKGRKTNNKRIEMVCKRSGEYESHKKKGYVYSKNRVFKPKTNKCGCPFKIVFHKVEGDIWRMYEVVNGCHNHDEDDALAQKKKVIDASSNRVTRLLRSHQGALYGPIQNHW